MNDLKTFQIKIVTLNVRGLNGPLKDGQFSDGYTIKKHISIFCKKPTAMKKQKPRGKQSGVERKKTQQRCHDFTESKV